MAQGTMRKTHRVSDCGLGIADSKSRPIRNPKSEIHNDACQYLVGGVNSPVRAFRHIGGSPLIVTRGRGARIYDAEGRAYVDFIMGWGALILGHNDPVIRRALQRQALGGTVLGLTHPAEIELARLIAEAVPSVEQVRFTVSGTEACMTAIRLARALTGRTKILMFKGCYHGHGDSAMAGKTKGIPEVLARETITSPYNDREALERVMDTQGTQLACAIIEPVAANMGVVVPEPGYLAQLRALTSRHGALLIFDEVVTGFRVAYGGAQVLFNVTPDLTTFGKIIGGGLPIGAVGGPKHFMQRLAPEGDVYHGGTFAGHPLSMVTGIAALRALKVAAPYAKLDQQASRLAHGLLAAAQRAGLPVQVNRVGSMLTVFFSRQPVNNHATASASDRERFAQWARELLRQGVLVPPSPLEALFVSTAHAARDIDRLVRHSNRIFRAMAK